MKMLKKSLLALCLATFGYVNAQFTMFTADGNTVIEDNHTVTYNTTDNTAEFEFKFKNETNADIFLRGEVVEMEGADGTQVQFCMEQCLNNVQVGTIVPTQGGFLVVANSTSPNFGTYFWNMNSSSDYKKYRFKIYQIDASGNQMGDAVHINYIYDANSVGVQDVQQFGFDIYPTVVKDNFTIELLDDSTVEVVNIQGKVVKNLKLKQGANSVNIEGIGAGVYFVRVLGRANSIKIIKQ